jgi:hypothetical protein
MAALPSMGALYISSPEQVSRSSVSSDSTQAEHQLVVGMSALQSRDDDRHRAYVPSHWSGCLGSQTSSDELDNYALHGSPALSSIPQTNSSNQSSPRSWDSPEQLGPTPWEAATEQLHSRYPGLDPQLPGYLPNGDIPTSFPADGLPFVPSHQTFDGTDNDYQRARSQTEPYPAGYHTSPRDGYPSTPESGHPLSPCSTTLSMPMDDMARLQDDDVDSQAPTLVNIGPETRPRSKRGSAPQLQPGEGKPEEPPYAQLIYRAFLSTPRQAMTLQEIYQWFRENTDKGKSTNKGWQNSIRHNLSMNQAFTKRERRSSTTTVDAKNGSTNPTQAETKKSTEWFLEPWAVAGVQSTTRYRKDNQSRRSAANHGLSSRVYRSYPAHHHHSFGRKGSRVLRGSRQSLRSNSSNAATTEPQLQQYHFPLSPHHHSATRGPFIHHPLNDPSSSPSPYGGPTSFFHQSPTQTHNMDRTTSGTGLNYNYPDPQLFPPNTSSASTPATMARASSEPGATLDEPVTPEPMPLLHHSPYNQLLPDLRGTTGGVVSPPPGSYHSHHHHIASHGGEIHGLPFAAPTGYPIPLPEEYGDAMDTDGGAYHQQQQQLHHHHHQQQIHGWVSTASGVVGLEGMGPCGEEGVSVPAGYGLGQGF